MNNMYYQTVMTDGAYLSFGKKAVKVIINDRVPDVLWFYNNEDVVIGIVPVKEVRYVRLCEE